MALAYYLSRLLPLVFVVVIAFFAIGHFFGWMFWGRYRGRIKTIEGQNEGLRIEIDQLQRDTH